MAKNNKVTKITGIAVAVDPLGYMVTYQYSILDESTGDVIESNNRKSFIAMDSEFKSTINDLYAYVEKREK